MSGPPAAGPAPLKGGLLAVTSIALALGTFMQVLDTTIANVALPTLSGNLGVSADNGTWVITSFACANGVTVPLTGWLMTRLGVVRTFVTAVVLFTLASLLCGIAWSLPSLIMFRVLQGAVSGPMIPGSQALLISIFPPEKRGTALGLWAGTTLVAPVMGPVLGGYISDHYHWGWIFLINVPVGLACAAITWRILGKNDTPTRKLPIDPVGLLLLMVWVFSLQTMLDLGKDRDWFHNSFITTLAICAAIGFVAWVIWELTESHPIVDISLFRRRNFAFGVLALCSAYSILFASGVLLPLWLQTDVGYTATLAGLVVAPSGVVAVLATPLFGRLRMDARIMASISFIALSASYFMRTRYTPDSSFWVLTMPLLLQGLSMACFLVPLLTILLDGLPADKVPSASGISNFARITAGSFGASLVTTFWDHREALHQTRLVEATTPFSPVYAGALRQLQGSGMNPLQAEGSVMASIVNQSYLMSTIDLFWACGWLMLGLIAVVWLCRRPAPANHAIAAD